MILDATVVMITMIISVDDEDDVMTPDEEDDNNLLNDILLLLLIIFADRVSVETLKECVRHFVLLGLPQEVRQVEKAALEREKGVRRLFL